MAAEPNMDEILDGFALWDELKPQSGEDWIAVAERFIADGATTENSSPLFAALVEAVSQLQAAESYAASLERAGDDLARILNEAEAEIVTYADGSKALTYEIFADQPEVDEAVSAWQTARKGTSGRAD